MIHLILSRVLFNSPIHRDVGWLGQPLPAGLKRGAAVGEYVLDKTGMAFVYVEPGSILPPAPSFFLNGQLPPPSQPVAVKAFYMAKYQVTVADFRKFVAETRYKTEAERTGFALRFGFPPQRRNDAAWNKPDFNQQENHPVVAVSWTDATKYCEWAGVRLPNNNEFLRGAYFDKKRGGLPPVPYYDVYMEPDFPRLYVNYSNDYLKEVQHLNLTANDKLDGYVYTAPVDAFPKGGSSFGVMDVGNVAEWSSDIQTQHAPNLHDGHFMNGGSYQFSAVHIDLFRFQPDDPPMLDVGFRVVLSAPGA